MYVRPVGAEQVSSNKLWYLPCIRRIAVQNANQPDKLIMVWDAAAEMDGVSLNSALFTGPDLNASLIHALIRMRKGRIAFSRNIEEMFPQIRIRQQRGP